MKSLQATARRGVLTVVASASALALVACSAGQITQTSSQVAAVDGSSAGTENDKVVVRDVTVHLTAEGETGLKFTAINQDPADQPHTLRSVTVGGVPVTFDGDLTINSDCSLVSDVASEIDMLVEPNDICITHVPSAFENTGLALGGNKDVVFTFDTGTIETVATISEPVPVAGENDRESGHEGHSH